MTNRIHIQNELNTVAPALVHAPVLMPYTLPTHYFSHLGEWTEAFLNMDKPGVLPNLPDGLQLPYAVPNNYFNDLSAWTSEVPHIETAHEKDLNLPVKMEVYTVPSGYFENLADDIISQIHQQENSVPNGYFEALPDFLLQKVRSMEVQEELETLAPILNNIDKKPVQSLPEGYFENTKPNIPAPAVIPAKVVSLPRRKSWMKYAVAASLVGIAGLTTFKVFDKSNTENPFPKTTFEQPVTANVDVTKELKKLDAASIKNYLRNNETSSEKLAADPNAEIKDIQYALQNFTDEELKKHLEEDIAY